MRSTSSWAELGLQWASVERPEAHRRLADALHRWRTLGPVGRDALTALVLEGRQPADATARGLEVARFVHCGESVEPVYAGAAVVACDSERRRLTRSQAAALLAWYRKGQHRVTQVYMAFHANRPHGLHVPFGVLVRAGLLVQVDGRRIHRSTVLGWAVAWLADDAALLELAGREAS